MSTQRKLADVPALDLLEMSDGKINNVIFFFQYSHKRAVMIVLSVHLLSSQGLGTG